jgi:hypothetical protein
MQAKSAPWTLALSHDELVLAVCTQKEMFFFDITALAKVK